MKKKSKLKGFTLVELIVVVAIFGLIMAAALSVIKPVGDLFVSTSKYENARSNSDNVRLYIEDNVRYADRFAVVKNSASYPTSAVDAFVDYFGKSIGGSGNPIYVMEINNDISGISGHSAGESNIVDSGRGMVTIYKNGTVYSKSNSNLYSDYGFKITNPVMVSSSSNLSAKLDIYHADVKSLVNTGSSYTMSYQKDDTGNEVTYYSTAVTFSMLNTMGEFKKESIKFYRRVTDSTLMTEAETAGLTEYDPIAHTGDYTVSVEEILRIADNSADGGIFSGGVADMGGSSDNIYFIYTLPKHTNQYSLS